MDNKPDPPIGEGADAGITPGLPAPVAPPEPPKPPSSGPKLSFSREKPTGQEKAASAESAADEGIVPIDYEPGCPSSDPLPCALDSLARLDQVPLLILHGRLGERAVAREVAALAAQKGVRWICRLDNGQEEGGGLLRLTDPETIRQEITAIDQYKRPKVTTRALLVAELNYDDLDAKTAWQELLLTTKRDQLIQALGEGNCALIVAVSVPNHEIDPCKRLTPALSSEVPWPDMLIRKLREGGRGTHLKDVEADRLRGVIHQYLSSANNRVLDAQFFAALEDIVDLQMDLGELEVELSRRLDKVVNDRDTERQAAEANRPDTPDRYDVRNAVHEAMVIVVLFLGTISRIAFDRLVSELLPDENVPEDLLPPERRRKAPALTGSAPSVTWSNPAWGGGVPASLPESITASTWRKSWAEDADFYREQCNIYVNGTNIALRGIWIKERQSVAMLERRQTRVELIAHRIVQRGIILVRDQLVANAASKLLAALLDRLGMALDKGSVLDIISQIIDVGLQSTDKPANLVDPLSTLFDDISDARGSAFPPIVYEALRDYARRNIRNRERCFVVTALCVRMRDAPPRWHAGQKFSEIVRQIVSEASQEVREAIEDALDFEYRYAVRNPALRIAFLAPLRPWLPSRMDQQPLLPTEALALQFWDDCLNRDTLWATPRTYEERGMKDTLASVAFGQDGERRAELVRGLAAFRLEHVAMLDTPNSMPWPLQDCFIDVFWMTLHGFRSTDVTLVLDNASRFALVFAAIAVTDKPVPSEIIIDISLLQGVVTNPDIEAEHNSVTPPTGIDTEVFQMVIKFPDPLLSLAYFYNKCFATSDQPTQEGRRARESGRKLDLFHAALIAEWFFLRFGIKEESLNDSDYAQVVALADTVCDIDREGLGARLPPAFMRLARIVECYGPILANIKVSRATSRAFYLKSGKLKGLANLFAARAKDAAARSRCSTTSPLSDPAPDRSSP